MSATTATDMRIVRARAAGGPEMLAVERAAAPVCGPHDVLVAVRLAGVNFADVNARRGTYGGPPGPRGLGRDVLGEVVEVGECVRRLRPGQRVAGFSTGPAYAELAVADESLVWAVPDGVADEQAAAFPTVGQTAYHLLATAARIRPGERVLVTAAAGGVGSVVVPLARLLGAERVVAAARTTGRAALAGADEALSYDELGARGGPGRAASVDVALDGVGGEARRAALGAIAPGGRLVHFGNSSGEPETLPAPRAQRERGLGVVGFHLEVLRRHGHAALAASAERLLGWLGTGELSIPVHDVLPLERAGDAHRLLESRTVRGKLLLSVGPVPEVHRGA